MEPELELVHGQTHKSRDYYPTMHRLIVIKQRDVHCVTKSFLYDKMLCSVMNDDGLLKLFYCMIHYFPFNILKTH